MIRFGTGGWRAVIGEDFIKDNVMLLAQAVANDMKAGNDSKGIVIGYDRRFLSDRAAKWLAEVMAGNGIKTFFINSISPTPLIMFTVKKLETSYGLAVTASHNPAEYNGVKVFTYGGRDAAQEVTQKIEGIADSLALGDIKSLSFEEGAAHGLIQNIDPFNDYIDTILSMIDVDVIRKKNLKVLLDPMFGVSKSSLQTILLTSRCRLDIINDRHDTLFGGRLPSPSAKTLHKLKDIVLESGYDLGIATDGDADRIGIIDDKGTFIHPNDILVLLYYYLARHKGLRGGVVRNVATTHLLDRIASAFGEECHEVPVGFKHISAKMEEKNAVIGGESSGGLTIRGHIKGKDGIFAATLLVEMICCLDKKISEILSDIHDEFGTLYMVESDARFTLEDKKRLQHLLFIERKLPGFRYEIQDVSYKDGVKVYFKNGGWVIARFSGTEPLLRIFSEMPEREMAEEINLDMQRFLNISGVIY